MARIPANGPKSLLFGPRKGTRAPAKDAPVAEQPFVPSKGFSFGAPSAVPIADKPYVPSKGFSFGAPVEAPFQPSAGFTFGSTKDTGVKPSRKEGRTEAGGTQVLTRASSKRRLSKKATDDDDLAIGSCGAVISAPAPKKSPSSGAMETAPVQDQAADQDESAATRVVQENALVPIDTATSSVLESDTSAPSKSAIAGESLSSTRPRCSFDDSDVDCQEESDVDPSMLDVVHEEPMLGDCTGEFVDLLVEHSQHLVERSQSKGTGAVATSSGAAVEKHPAASNLQMTPEPQLARLLRSSDKHLLEESGCDGRAQPGIEKRLDEELQMASDELPDEQRSKASPSADCKVSTEPQCTTKTGEQRTPVPAREAVRAAKEAVRRKLERQKPNLVELVEEADRSLLKRPRREKDMHRKNREIFTHAENEVMVDDLSAVFDDEPKAKKKRAAPKRQLRKQPEGGGDPEDGLSQSAPRGKAKAAPKRRAKKSESEGLDVTLDDGIRERAVPKRRSKKSSAEQNGEGSAPLAPKKPLPYGANFVRQDFKKMATKGRTAHSKHVTKFFGANGKLKPQYTRRADAQAQHDAFAAFRGSSKKQRHRHWAEQSLQERTLANNGKVELSTKSFSPAITETLLQSLHSFGPSSGLGEIAHTRPPDNVSSLEPTIVPLQDIEVPVDANLGNKGHVSEPPDDGPQASQASTAEPSTDASVPSSLDGFGEASTPEMVPLPQRDPADHDADSLREVLRHTFQHEEFRPGQQEAISSVLACKKTLLLLSTGCGKSLCYQIPAFLLREEGLTLVISPLVSLMQDQLQRLPACLRGAIVSSQQSRDECRTVMKAVRARLIDVLYISPERLSMWAFDGCGLPPIALACIDEAHCVSEWSHNFRPDYLRLNEFLIDSLRAKRLLALTATATRPTLKSVCDILKLDVVVRSDRSYLPQEIIDEPAQPRVQRTNLTMDVKQFANEDAQVRALVDLLRSEEYAKSSAIVYVWRKISCDQLAKRLRVWIRGGVSSYHGGLLPETRRAVQDAFMVGTARVVIATMSFGMGLDKPDIRLVVHFNIPKSIEHYVQETGRCSRDGAQGHCVALVNPRDFKSMRWVTSAGGGGGSQAGTIRRLLGFIFGRSNGDGEGRTRKLRSRHELSVENAAKAYGQELLAGVPESWNPYYITFEEAEIAKELNIDAPELHSILAHFAYRARGQVALHSKFPTKMKLRFFKTAVEELAQSDPLLKKIIPLAKVQSGVHTVETAHALAQLGGQPSQLSNGLWQAQADEFSLEKADYGYMIAILRPADEHLVESWVADLVSINRIAHKNVIEKLDAIYFALTRAAEVSTAAPSTGNGSESDGSPEKPVDALLTKLIDTYFAETSDPSGVIAGGRVQQAQMLKGALGNDYRPPDATTAYPAASSRTSAETTRASEQQQLEGDAVYSVVARLIMSPEWPTVPSEDPGAIAHAIAQFLAGMSTLMFPAKKWKAHRCWGRFKEFGDFEVLEQLVGSAHHRLQSAIAARRQPVAADPKK